MPINKYSKKIIKYLRRKKNEFFLKLLPKNQIYISPLGFKMNLSLDKQVDKEIFMEIFESETQNFYAEIVKKGMVIFDIGANKGLYSLIAASKIEPDGKIVSFEPAPKAYDALVSNILLNNFTTIYPFKVGIADKQGEVIFNICKDDAYNSIGNNPLKPIKEKQVIKTISIDEFCESQNIDKIDLMKIDTEGAEELAIKGGIKTLSKDNGPLIICEYNSKTDYGIANSTGMFNLLKKMGYSIFQLKSGQLLPFELSNYNSSEIFCLKKSHHKAFLTYINEKK